MAGYRTSVSPEWTKSYQQEWASKGVLRADLSPYNVTPSNGPQNNMDGLERALNEGRTHMRRVILPGDGDNAPIMVDRGCRVMHDKIPPGLGGTVGGGGFSSRAYTTSLEGYAVNGNFPRIRAVDNAEKSRFNVGNMTELPSGGPLPAEIGEGYAIMSWGANQESGAYKKNAFQNVAGDMYAAVLRNLSIETGANDWLIGFEMAGAQGCMILKVIFDATGGFVGFMNPPGSGAATISCEFIGGEVGLYCQDYRPTPNIFACKFRDQTRTAIYSVSNRNGLMAWGCDFDMPAGVPAYLTPESVELAFGGGTAFINNGEHYSVGNFNCLNTRFKQADGEPAVQSFDGAHHLIDSWADAAVISEGGDRNGTLRTLNGTAGQWSHIPMYHMLPQSVGQTVYEDGVRGPTSGSQEVLPLPLVPGATPWSFEVLEQIYGLRDQDVLSIWEDEDAVVFFDDEHGTAKRHDPNFDNGLALNLLLLNQADAGHPDFGKPIVIGRGFFYCKSAVRFLPGSKVRGVGTQVSILAVSSERRPQGREPVAIVPDDENQMVFLQDFGMAMWEPKHVNNSGGMIVTRNLKDHQELCLLEVQGSVNMAGVQLTRYEFYNDYGDPNPTNNQMMIWAHKRACGIIRALPCDMVDARDVMDTEFRPMQFGPMTGGNYRLIVADINPEGLAGYAQITFDRAHDIIATVKAEVGVATRHKDDPPEFNMLDLDPVLAIRDTQGAMLLAGSGNQPTYHTVKQQGVTVGDGKVWDEGLYLIEGYCGGLLMCGIDRTHGSVEDRHMVVVRDPGNTPPPPPPPVDPGLPPAELEDLYLQVPTITGEVHYPVATVSSIEEAVAGAKGGDAIAIPSGEYGAINFAPRNSGATSANPVVIIPLGDGPVALVDTGNYITGDHIWTGSLLVPRNLNEQQGQRRVRVSGTGVHLCYWRFEQEAAISLEFLAAAWECRVHRTWFVGPPTETGMGLFLKMGVTGDGNREKNHLVDRCRFYNAQSHREAIWSGKAGHSSLFLCTIVEGGDSPGTKDIVVRHAVENTISYTKGARRISVNGPGHTILNNEVTDKIEAWAGSRDCGDAPDYEPWPDSNTEGSDIYVRTKDTHFENNTGPLVIGGDSYGAPDPAEFLPTGITVANHTGGITYKNNAPKAQTVAPVVEKSVVPTIETADVYTQAYADHANPPTLDPGNPEPPPPPPDPTPTTGTIEKTPPLKGKIIEANPSNWISKINSAEAGDHVVLVDGDYTPANATFKGVAGKPVVVRPKVQNSYGVKITGATSWYIYGAYGWITGLMWDGENAGSGGRRHFRVYGNNMTFAWIETKRIGGIDFEAAGKGGKNMRVHRCHGHSKKNNSGDNGAEFFKMGGGYFINVNAGLIADYNKVDNYYPEGEGELFSLKADGCRVIGNHLTGQSKDISFRSANDCTVELNTTPNRMRVNGRNHVINNNSAGAINLQMSTVSGLASSNGDYPRTEGCQLSGNIGPLRISLDKPTGGSHHARNNKWDKHTGSVSVANGSTGNSQASLGVDQKTPVNLSNNDVGVRGFWKHAQNGLY